MFEAALMVSFSASGQRSRKFAIHNLVVEEKERS